MQGSGSRADSRYLWQIDVNHGLSSRLSSDGAQMSAALDGGHAEVKDDYIPSPSLPGRPPPPPLPSAHPLALRCHLTTFLLCTTTKRRMGWSTHHPNVSPPHPQAAHKHQLSFPQVGQSACQPPPHEEGGAGGKREGEAADALSAVREEHETRASAAKVSKKKKNGTR